MTSVRRFLFLFICAAVLAGCLTSRVITVTITNRSSGELRNLEVTYPGGSYGVSSLAAGASHQYKIKPFFEGELQLQWMDTSGATRKFTGPKLHKDDEGDLAIAISGEEVRTTPAIISH